MKRPAHTGQHIRKKKETRATGTTAPLLTVAALLVLLFSVSSLDQSLAGTVSSSPNRQVEDDQVEGGISESQSNYVEGWMHFEYDGEYVLADEGDFWCEQGIESGSASPGPSENIVYGAVNCYGGLYITLLAEVEGYASCQVGWDTGGFSSWCTHDLFVN